MNVFRRLASMMAGILPFMSTTQVAAQQAHALFEAPVCSFSSGMAGCMRSSTGSSRNPRKNLSNSARKAKHKRAKR